MINIFKYVERFFESLTVYLTHNYIFLIFVGLFLFTMFSVIIFTSRSYEARLIKAIDKLNVYFIDNPHINEENLVAFNARMKSKKVPKQLRKNWQQFVLYREGKASSYMSFENCVANPIKNSTYTRDVKTMNSFAWIFSICSALLSAFRSLEGLDTVVILREVLLAPSIILLLNYLVQIFLSLRHSAIVSDLFQNYQYFEVNVDKATETLPDYVDYEVLFDKNEIKKGIPILYAYLQKRAEEEQRELERARLRNVEHEKFNFDDQGVAASLVLERAMQEAENYIAERKKYNQDIAQINGDITQEDMNYREITKEYNRQMQVSKETFENFKSQLQDVSSSIEANYLKKQQQQELDRQRNLERDFDTATERHKKVLEDYQAELDSVDKFIAASRKGLEDAMKSEFSSYSSKVYDEAKKLVDERQKEKLNQLKQEIENLEETIVQKNQELENVYQQNQMMSDKLEEIGIAVNDQAGYSSSFKPAETEKPKAAEPVKEEIRDVQSVQEPETVEEQPQYQPLKYEPLKYEEPEDEEPPVAEIKPEYIQPQQVEEDETKEVEEVQESQQEETSYSSMFDDNDALFGNNAELFKDKVVRPEEEVKVNNADDLFSSNDSLFGDSFDEEPKQETDKTNDDLFGSDDDLFKSDDDLFASNETKEETSKSSDLLKNIESFESEILNKAKDIENDVDDLFNNNEDLFGSSEEDEDVEEDEFEEEDLEEISTESNDDSIEKSVSRRGRPRKVVEAVQTQGEKKRPGRPRKEKTDEAVEKRSVGRPRKEVSKPVSKKGPGRPKKEVTEKVAAPVKKGRGRPRKEKTDEVVEKRSVGRPRKEASKPVSKKGPGRPKKEVVEKIATPVKKGRGRPRKDVSSSGVTIQKGDNMLDKEFDEYLKEIENQIAAENAKLEETQRELAKKAKLKSKK